MSKGRKAPRMLPVAEPAKTPNKATAVDGQDQMGAMATPPMAPMNDLARATGYLKQKGKY